MEQLIKSKERVKKYGEVFTPVWLVNDMLDLLPEDMFEIDKTFLEPACGEGVFILEILKRKFKNCKKRSDYAVALSSVYGLELLADNVEICIQNVINLCKEYFKPNKKEIEIINDHIIQCDSLKIMRMMADERLKERGETNDR